jgi:predicted ATPase/DNA-binding CsgD family transcriptional regulator
VTTPNNLPAELSSFVGRERELAELRRLLRKSRLITLTGSGGAGKTRLALRLAGNVLDRHPDGAWLVDLAALGDARLLEQTVASACGILEERRRPVLEVLTEGLKGRRTLLILDGCEHLVEACAELASDLLRSCPKLTLVATSREPLGVPGELIWRTPSLSLPRVEDAGRPALALESEAVRLFVERARLSRPGFELGQASSASDVAQICARLEGIPLAIELAASLARLMSIEEILERLRDRFRLLTGGSRTALPRHQTLRQAVDWSYGLLSSNEKALLERLAVFAGGFDLPAAEAVAPGEDSGAVLPVLSRLVDKSLVAAEASGSARTRFRLLDTIREYAIEKLQQSGESDARQRHAGYFVEWCDSVVSELASSEQGRWLKRIDEEQGNIRLALDWSLAEQPDVALRLAAAMGPYWNMRCHIEEGLGWLDRALEARTSNLYARPIALLARARIRTRHGDYATARVDAIEALELSREGRLSAEVSAALTVLGVLSAVADDMGTSDRYHEEALQIALQTGDRARVAACLNNLALLDSARGDNEGARARLEQAVKEATALGDTFLIAQITDSLAVVVFRLGDTAAALRLYLKALEIAVEFEDSLTTANGLEGVALLAFVTGDAAKTVKLMAAANGLRAAIGGEPTPDWSEKVEEGLQAARAKLGRQAAEVAWRHGAALSMGEAVRLAGGTGAPPIRDRSSPLTARESQVAALVGEGLTNPEIAQRLKMAGRTADAHIEHIRNKLGLRSRSQIAVWAHERLGRS